MEDHNRPTEDYDNQGSDCVMEGGTADTLSGIGNNQGADHAGFGGAPEGLRDLPGLTSTVLVGVPHHPPTISHDKIQCPAPPNLKDCDYQDMEQVGGALSVSSLDWIPRMWNITEQQTRNYRPLQPP